MVDEGGTPHTRRKLIPVLVEGIAEKEEDADKIASKFRHCPYVSFIATEGNRVFFTYSLPEEQRWWMREIEKEPKRHMGLKKVKVTYPERLYYPNEMKVRYPRRSTQASFCDPKSNFVCSSCPGYSVCLGCPGTTYFKK